MITISKKDWMILIGNAIDHFDVALYIFLAPILATDFFPNNNPIIELIFVYSVLTTSVITRPLGTYIFANLVKLFGASRMLSFSLMGVGVTTLIMGFLPNYHMIGFIGPVLLILIRMVRNIFATGESAIAKLYILHDKQEKEAFKGSYLYQTSSAFGTMSASFAATLAFYLNIDYAWRICFCIGGIAAIICSYVRFTEITIKKTKQEKILRIFGYNSLKILLKYRVSLIKIAIVNSFSHITYAIPFIIMNNIIPLITNIKTATMMSFNTIMLVIDVIAIPIIGEYTKSFSTKNVMLTASLVLTITIIPLWNYIDNSSIIYISFVRLWIVFWGIVFLCPLNLWCNQQVRGDNKYMVIGMGTSLADCTIGKLTPSLCLILYYYSNSHILIGIYTALIFAITAISLNTKHTHS